MQPGVADLKSETVAYSFGKMFTVLRRSFVLLPRKFPEQSVSTRTFTITEKVFDDQKLQLWSDGGKNIALSSSDNIGGWHTDHLSLIDSVDVNSVKYQSLKGKKKTNEDRVQIMEILPDVLFVGVFDGHGGSFVVDFVSQNIHLYIKRLLEQGKFSLTAALRKGFIDCDSSLQTAIEKGKFLSRSVVLKLLFLCLIKARKIFQARKFINMYFFYSNFATVEVTLQCTNI